MSETATPESIRLYAFGSWTQSEIADSGEPTPTGQRIMDFLTGKPVGALSEREAELLLQEFTAQERYRTTLQAELLKVVGELQAEAGACVQTGQAPYRVSGGYESGMNLGKNMAYADAAQRVQNIVNRLVVKAQERP